MKKLIYDKVTGEFTQNSDAVLDPTDWVNDFKRFIIAQLRSANVALLPKKSFSRIKSKYEVRFKEASMIQIHIMDLIINKKLPIKQLLGNSQVLADGFIKYVKGIQNSTISKLKILPIDSRPDNSGWEELDHIEYRGRKCNSLESQGDHRIIYDIHDPYRITVISLFFHYGREPKGTYDKVLLEIYNDFASETPSDQDINTSFKKFVDKL